MQGQKSNTDKAKFWTMLMVTAMNQSYLKDLGGEANWDKHVVGLGFKPWTFEELICITSRTTLKVSVIMLVSARLARPSLEVHLRFTIVPKQFLGDQAQIDFADLENDQVWISFSTSTFKNHHQEQHHIEIEAQEKQKTIMFILDIWNLERKSPREAWWNVPPRVWFI